MTAIKPPDLTPPPIAPVRGDRNTFSDRLDAFITWLVGFVTQSAALASNVNANAIDAYNSALQANASQAAAAASQAAAAASAASSLASPSTSATSSTALTIAAVLQTLVIQTGKNFAKGMTVKIAMTAAPDTWMIGDIISYDSAAGQLVVAVNGTQNLGTASAWTVSISAPPSREVTRPTDTQYTYLPNGLVAKESATIAGFPRVTSYSYRADGSLRTALETYRGKSRLEHFYFGQNMLSNTRELGGTWNLYRVSVTRYALVDPQFGDLCAIAGSSAMSTHAVGQVSVANAVIGELYTLAATCKAGRLGWCILELNHNGVAYVAYFNLLNGAVGGSSAVRPKIVPLNSGAFRVSASMVAGASAQIIGFVYAAPDNMNNTYAGDNVTPDIYCGRVQLSQGSDQPYVDNYSFIDRPSVGTYYDKNGVIQYAPAGVARMSYNPLDLSQPPALLLEPASTNVMLYSQDLTKPQWIRRGTAQVQLSTVGTPDGGSVAALITGLGIGGISDIYQHATGLTANLRHEPSFWMVPLSSGKIIVQVPAAADNGYWIVDFSKVSTAGWSRITRNHPAVTVVTEFTSVATGVSGMQMFSFDSSVQSLWIWGLQLEPGTCSSSYIPTLNAPASRAADTFTSTTYSDGRIAATYIEEF